MRRSDVSAGIRSGLKRGGGQESARKKWVLVWSAAIGLVSLTVIGLTISMWLIPHLNQSSATREGDP